MFSPRRPSKAVSTSSFANLELPWTTIRSTCTPGTVCMTTHGSRALGIMSISTRFTVAPVPTLRVSSSGASPVTVTDASTFDSDPFEPQPDGVGTIFPFQVAGSIAGRGYIELPYTLVQDFTLFVLLREKSIDLWSRKAAWVAECGGMVLLNTHPDYMCFGESGCQRDEFDVSLYEKFLLHMRKTYKDLYWQALPCEVARFCRSAPGVTAKPDRVWEHHV